MRSFLVGGVSALVELLDCVCEVLQSVGHENAVAIEHRNRSRTWCFLCTERGFADDSFSFLLRTLCLFFKRIFEIFHWRSEFTGVQRPKTQKALDFDDVAAQSRRRKMFCEIYGWESAWWGGRAWGVVYLMEWNATQHKTGEKPGTCCSCSQSQ